MRIKIKFPNLFDGSDVLNFTSWIINKYFEIWI